MATSYDFKTPIARATEPGRDLRLRRGVRLTRLRAPLMKARYFSRYPRAVDDTIMGTFSKTNGEAKQARAWLF